MGPGLSAAAGLPGAGRLGPSTWSTCSTVIMRQILLSLGSCLLLWMPACSAGGGDGDTGTEEVGDGDSDTSGDGDGDGDEDGDTTGDGDGDGDAAIIAAGWSFGELVDNPAGPGVRRKWFHAADEVVQQRNGGYNFPICQGDYRGDCPVCEFVFLVQPELCRPRLRCGPFLGRLVVGKQVIQVGATRQDACFDHVPENGSVLHRGIEVQNPCDQRVCPSSNLDRVVEIKRSELP